MPSILSKNPQAVSRQATKPLHTLRGDSLCYCLLALWVFSRRCGREFLHAHIAWAQRYKNSGKEWSFSILNKVNSMFFTLFYLQNDLYCGCIYSLLTINRVYSLLSFTIQRTFLRHHTLFPNRTSHARSSDFSFYVPCSSWQVQTL